MERSNTFLGQKIMILPSGADGADGGGSDTGTTVTVAGRNVADLILQHPLVRNHAMCGPWGWGVNHWCK